MKTLVISRPYYDYILPLNEFPADGDKFIINNSINTINNTGSLIAITLAKYSMDISITGMIADDDNGKKIIETFNNYKVDTRYIEVSYGEKTNCNYKIYNSKTNTFTLVEEKGIKNSISKYKYDFTPDVIIMDDGEYEANLAAINNFPDSNLIYIGKKFTNSSKIYCNKCKYIVSNLQFASIASSVSGNFNNKKNIVQLFQKYIDLYSSNLIILLSNFDILYCVNDEVRIIKNVNNNLKNKEDIYISVLCYYLANTNNIELSIKLTNRAMLESKSSINMIDNIPEYNLIKTILDEKINKEDTITTNSSNGVNEIEKL